MGNNQSLTAYQSELIVSGIVLVVVGIAFAIFVWLDSKRN
ncbi:hypothetical protein YOLOSWAG_189 [Erwinia phage vB_EamM_Yoloswag]|uniref:Uncharacterized protein n=1 Tax=Erwinia phage vB_EamM_Yoloswag TaxID=1958956 RepID=A0A1S6L3B0_9CAUD|nr:hypothetical protein HOR66_gp189 [Erwinia phage vB_EamM_Yoloswag]AQT28668.1 hypothetical protein YOLOSWAG_189 [Erwinia phage vB_EamM_Yoloswag]